MATFCALCAQPGINLPENWREYENRWAYRYCYLEAANISFQQKPFHARLYDGWQLLSRAYEDEEPWEWCPTFWWNWVYGQERTVQVAPEVSSWEAAGQVNFLHFGRHLLTLWQRSMCHDHCAVNNVNKHGGHLESTGIGAMACIHGAFVPDSVVDFQRGEVWVHIFISVPCKIEALRVRKTWTIPYSKPSTLTWTA